VPPRYARAGSDERALLGRFDRAVGIGMALEAGPRCTSCACCARPWRLSGISRLWLAKSPYVFCPFEVAGVLR
jgi:hypothetical protein